MIAYSFIKSIAVLTFITSKPKDVTAFLRSCLSPIKASQRIYITKSIMSSKYDSTDNDDANTNVNKSLPCINGSETVGSTKWLRLETLSYTDQNGKERKWDYATRTTKISKTSTDAVAIIPLLKRPYVEGGDPEDTLDTLLVEQYRPPLGRRTLEFPAGLIDDGETIEQAALRELTEETGYVGEACKIIPKVSPQVCMSPGLCDETVQCVVVTIDLDNPYNDPTNSLHKPSPDDGEFIKVHRVSLKAGLHTLLEDVNNDTVVIQGLYLFALGLQIGRSMK